MTHENSIYFLRHNTWEFYIFSVTWHLKTWDTKLENFIYYLRYDTWEIYIHNESPSLRHNTWEFYISSETQHLRIWYIIWDTTHENFTYIMRARLWDPTLEEELFEVSLWGVRVDNKWWLGWVRAGSDDRVDVLVDDSHHHTALCQEKVDLIRPRLVCNTVNSLYIYL
jgi:hypothetical protein